MSRLFHVAFLSILLAAVCRLPAADTPSDLTALQKRVSELEAEVVALRQQSVTFKALADVDIDMWLRSANEDDASGIPATIVTLLGLSAEERAALKVAADKARTEIGAAIAEQKPMAEAVPDGFRLVVRDFSDEGKLIEGRLQKSIRIVLGPDRQRLFKRLQRHLTASQFFAFGEGTQTFTFTKQDGSWNHKREIRSDNGSGSSSGGLGNSLARFALLRPYLPKELIEGVEGPPATQPKGADNF